MRTRWVVALSALFIVGAACASGPSSPDLRPPTTTTTTEPPPEGVFVINITNGAFRPSVLALDITTTPIVEWRHDDLARFEYTITSDEDLFESPVLAQGDTFQFDFGDLPPSIYRYTATLGRNRIPGSIDTRPSQ